MTISMPVVFFLLLGLIVGSFLNVCIFRIPEGIFFRSHRSCCRECGAVIPFYCNIPVLSFLFLRGKARCCGTRISPQYPLVEVATAFVFIGLFYKYLKGLTIVEGDIHSMKQMVRFAHALVFTCVLLVTSVIDMRHRIIPDVISLPMIFFAPLAAWFHPELYIQTSFLGIALGGGSIYLVAWIYYLIRKREGIGMGDAKLLAMIGGWLGYQSIFPTFFIASILGTIVGLFFMVKKRSLVLSLELPFGPFLSVAAMIYYFVDSPLIERLTILH